jgi:hypothetical protein
MLKKEIQNFASNQELRESTAKGCDLVKKKLEEHSFSAKSSDIIRNVLLDI